MRNCFNVCFYCRQSKASKKTGLAKIEIAVTVNGDRHFFNTQYECKPSDFNRKRQPKEIRDYCDLMRQRINEILTDMLAHNEPVTTKAILSYLRNGGYRSETVEDVFNAYLEANRDRIGSDLTEISFNKYKNAAANFYDIVGKDREFSSLTNADIVKFKSAMTKKYAKSSLASTLTKVKTMINFGRANGKLRTDIWNGVKIEKELKPVETITEDELSRIMTTKYVSDRVTRMADLFTFSAGSGLSFADTQALTPDDFIWKDGKLCVFKERKKTGVKYYSVLLPCAQTIALKYAYELPKISNQKCNSTLKDVQTAANITSVDSLHFHLARHFYAMALLNAGVPVTTLQKCLGHKSMVMSTHYAHAVESTIVREVSEAFS